MDIKKFIPECAFALPAYWDRARVEKCRKDLRYLQNALDRGGLYPTGAITDAVTLLYFILNPDKISQDTSDGPVGMDEVDHD